jgi:type I restriction enzyme S subunit
MKAGWEVKTLGEICKFVRGPFGGSLKKDIFVQDGYAVYEQQHAIYNQFNEIRYFIEQKKFEEMSRFELRANDLIMSCSGTMGKVAIVPAGIKPGIINQALLKLSPSNLLLPEFLKYWMESDSFQDGLKEQSGGAAIQNVASVAILKEIKITLPVLTEQLRIVAILDQAFEGIAKTRANAEQNLQNARALFESHLQSVFTQRGEGWKWKKLAEVCEEIFAGGDVPKENHSKTPTDKHLIPIFTNGEKNGGLYGFTDKARVTTPSITISARGTIGYSEIRRESYYPAIRLIVVIPKNEILNLSFLHYAVMSMDIGHSGTSIPQLTVPMVKAFAMPIPSLEVQQRSAEQLDDLLVETQRLEAIYQRKIACLDELKKSLLQQAFAGEL